MKYNSHGYKLPLYVLNGILLKTTYRIVILLKFKKK